MVFVQKIVKRKISGNFRMSSTAAIAERQRAQVNFLQDLQKKYGRSYNEGRQGASQHENSAARKSSVAQEKRVQRMDMHYQRQYEKQVKIVNKFNQRGIKLDQPQTSSPIRNNFQDAQTSPLILKSVIAEKSANSQVCDERKKQLDEKIKRSQGYQSPLELFREFGKQDKQERVSNKIHLEELVRLQRKNMNTTFYDATLDFIKISGGNDHGLELAGFVQLQMQQEQKLIIKQELQNGLSVIKGQPRDDICRYWKDKVKLIKAYIKAHKYDIAIPKQLNFEESDEEMFNEPCSFLQTRIRSASKRAYTQNNQSPDFIVKSNSLEREKDQINLGHASPENGKNYDVRPNTATTMMRLRKATSISAHRHNWRHRSIDSQTNVNNAEEGFKAAISINNDRAVNSTHNESTKKVRPRSDLLHVSGISKAIGNRHQVKKSVQTLTSSVPQLYDNKKKSKSGEADPNYDLNVNLENIPSHASSKLIIGETSVRQLDLNKNKPCMQLVSSANQHDSMTSGFTSHMTPLQGVIAPMMIPMPSEAFPTDQNSVRKSNEFHLHQDLTTSALQSAEKNLHVQAEAYYKDRDSIINNQNVNKKLKAVASCTTFGESSPVRHRLAAGQNSPYRSMRLGSAQMRKPPNTSMAVHSSVNHTYADQPLKTASNSIGSSRSSQLAKPLSHSLLNRHDQIQIQSQAKTESKLEKQAREQLNTKGSKDSLRNSKQSKLKRRKNEVSFRQKHSSVDMSAGLDYQNLNTRPSLQVKARISYSSQTCKKIKSGPIAASANTAAATSSNRMKRYKVNHDLMLAETPDYMMQKLKQKNKALKKARISQSIRPKQQLCNKKEIIREESKQQINIETNHQANDQKPYNHYLENPGGSARRLSINSRPAGQESLLKAQIFEKAAENCAKLDYKSAKSSSSARSLSHEPLRIEEDLDSLERREQQRPDLSSIRYSKKRIVKRVNESFSKSVIQSIKSRSSTGGNNKASSGDRSVDGSMNRSLDSKQRMAVFSRASVLHQREVDTSFEKRNDYMQSLSLKRRLQEASQEKSVTPVSFKDHQQDTARMNSSHKQSEEYIIKTAAAMLIKQNGDEPIINLCSNSNAEQILRPHITGVMSVSISENTSEERRRPAELRTQNRGYMDNTPNSGSPVMIQQPPLVVTKSSAQSNDLQMKVRVIPSSNRQAFQKRALSIFDKPKVFEEYSSSLKGRNQKSRSSNRDNSSNNSTRNSQKSLYKQKTVKQSRHKKHKMLPKNSDKSGMELEDPGSTLHMHHYYRRNSADQTQRIDEYDTTGENEMHLEDPAISNSEQQMAQRNQFCHITHTKSIKPGRKLCKSRVRRNLGHDQSTLCQQNFKFMTEWQKQQLDRHKSCNGKKIRLKNLSRVSQGDLPSNVSQPLKVHLPVSGSAVPIHQQRQIPFIFQSGSKLASLRPVSVCSKRQVVHRHGLAYYASKSTKIRDAEKSTIQSFEQFKNVNAANDESIYNTIETYYNNNDGQQTMTQSSPQMKTITNVADILNPATLSPKKQTEKDLIPTQSSTQKQYTTLHVNTLSMKTSLNLASEMQEQRERQLIESQKIRGVNKMGGFRRPSTSSFYQVKKVGYSKPLGMQMANADLPTQSHSNSFSYKGRRLMTAKSRATFNPGEEHTSKTAVDKLRPINVNSVDLS